jgi:hypothetical protein
MHAFEMLMNSPTTTPEDVFPTMRYTFAIPQIVNERIIVNARLEFRCTWKRAFACWRQLKILSRRVGED